MFSSPEQFHRFKAEGGEGAQPAAKSDNKKQPDLIIRFLLDMHINERKNYDTDDIGNKRGNRKL